MEAAMKIGHRILNIAAAVIGSAIYLAAQGPANPSGHWQGAVQMPNNQQIAVEIDLAKNANGVTQATFSGVNIKGYPLSDVAFDGPSVRFNLKVDGGGAFSGKFSEDGKTMAGEFTATNGGYVLPFSLTRSGDAVFEPVPRNPRIGKELEGTWSGALEVNGMTMRIQLKMANQADGTSSGSLSNLDQGAVDLPVSSISQTASTVNIGLKMVNGSFSGTLNAAGTELTGTWTQGTFSAPLNFHRER
jgi:hypothetical protein